MKQEKNYEVVVGIDFGSSGCGFAYSFMNEDKIFHCDIPGADVDKKVPTEVILDDYNEILTFGPNCKQYLKEKGLNKGHHYFKGIKMNLYKKTKTIKSNNSDKTLPLVLVIQKVLEKLKDLCLEQLRKSWNNIEEKSIKWVVTVPAIWGDFEKGVMMEACQNANLIKKNDDKSLFFALEPEAASYYCCRKENINEKYIMEGNFYIVCDLGGGTGDIVAHLVGCNQHLEEFSTPRGGGYGSNEIDKKIFKHIIKNLFGYEDFNSLYKKYEELLIREDEGVIYEGWCNLEKSIKEFKEGINLEKIKNGDKYPICCDVFQDFFDEDDLDINDLVDKYNEALKDNDLKLNVKSEKKWIVEFPYKIIENYVEEQSKLICNEIKAITSSIKEEINSIIFVGGYCANEVLISKIKNGLNKNYNYIQPHNPSLAIMDGAVLFGLDPTIINFRIAKYTIGLEIRDIWDDKKHSEKGEKIFNESDETWRCENCFYKFIEVNQKIKYDETLPPQSFSMVDPRTATLTFYKSLKTNPVFTFENGVEKIVECELDAKKDYPVGQRDVKVYMSFGGTYIDVKAIHEQSGKQIEINLNYE